MKWTAIHKIGQMLITFQNVFKNWILTSKNEKDLKDFNPV